MGSLSDSENMGARITSTQHYYGNIRLGPGRWAVLDGLGILWTDDHDALQLARLDDADQVAATAVRIGLHTLARELVPAGEAFDGLVAEYSAPVMTGNLAEIATLAGITIPVKF